MEEFTISAVQYESEDFEAVAPIGGEISELFESINCEVCCPGACTGCTECNSCNLMF